MYQEKKNVVFATPFAIAWTVGAVAEVTGNMCKKSKLNDDQIRPD